LHVPDAKSASFPPSVDALRPPLTSSGGTEAAADLLVLTGLVAVLFHRTLFGGEVFFERDIASWWWGQTAAFSRAVTRGAWPLWDPTLGFGQPMLANPSTQVCYPWTWLSILFSVEVVYTVYVVSHWLIAGAGMYALGRHLGLSRGGARVGAGLWLLGGPFLSTVNLWHHQAGVALLPAVLWSANRLLEVPVRRRALLFAALLAFQVLAGSAEMCAMTALLVAAASVRRVLRACRRPAVESDGDVDAAGAPVSRVTKAVRPLAALALGVFCAAGLSAAQWLPSVDLVRQGTERAGLPEAMRTYWSVRPALLAQLVVPAMTQRLPLSPAAHEALYESGRGPFLASLYLGLAAFPFVALALLQPCPSHRGLARLVAGFLVTSAAVALGRHFVAYEAITTLLPPLRVFRYPAKAALLTGWSWALLAGIGWTAWESGLLRRSVRASIAVGTALLAALNLAAAAFALGHGSEWLQAPADGAVREIAGHLAATAVIALATAWAIVRGPAPARAGRWSLGCAGLLFLDLYTVHAGLNPTVPKGTFSHPPPTLDALRGAALPRVSVFDYRRIAGKAYRQRPSEDEARDMTPPVEDPVLLARIAQSDAPALRRWGVGGSFEQDGVGLETPQVQGLSFFFHSREETPGFTRLLRLAAVTAVLARHERGFEDFVPLGTFDDGNPQPLRVLGVPDPLPRAYAVGTGRIASGVSDYGVVVDPGFDPAREVVLREGTPLHASPAFESQTRMRQYEADSLVVDVALNEPGYLVVSDAFAPQWKAAVDGVATPVLRANVAFRAVLVPAGRHTVEMRYRPRAVMVGLWMSGAFLLLFLIAGAWDLPGASRRVQGVDARAAAG
jgi:hypothetical protein